MSQLSNAPRFYKAMREKFQKQYSILRERRYCRQVLIILQEYGMLRQVRCFRHCKAMMMRSFHVNSTTKETQLSRVQRTTLAVFGETLTRLRNRS